MWEKIEKNAKWNHRKYPCNSLHFGEMKIQETGKRDSRDFPGAKKNIFQKEN